MKLNECRSKAVKVFEEGSIERLYSICGKCYIAGTEIHFILVIERIYFILKNEKAFNPCKD